MCYLCTPASLIPILEVSALVCWIPIPVRRTRGSHRLTRSLVRFFPPDLLRKYRHLYKFCLCGPSLAIDQDYCLSSRLEREGNPDGCPFMRWGCREAHYGVAVSAQETCRLPRGQTATDLDFSMAHAVVSGRLCEFPSSQHTQLESA